MANTDSNKDIIKIDFLVRAALTLPISARSKHIQAGTTPLSYRTILKQPRPEF
jgi:hypothetical protein